MTLRELFDMGIVLSVQDYMLKEADGTTTRLYWSNENKSYMDDDRPISIDNLPVIAITGGSYGGVIITVAER